MHTLTRNQKVSFKHDYKLCFSCTYIHVQVLLIIIILCQNNYFNASFVFQASRDVVLYYSTSLSRLHQLSSTMCSCLSDITAVVVTQVAKLCHCASVHELLVGKESISSSFSSSPYIQAQSTNTNSVTEHGPVKPAEPVELSNTSNNSVSVSKETSDENSQINQLFSRGHNTYSAVLPLKENNAPSSVGLNRSHFEEIVLRNVLALLRGRLKKETWKSQPTAKHALIWC